MKSLRKIIFSLLIWASLGSAYLFAEAPRDQAVELNAAVQENPPRITLAWNATMLPPQAQRVFRRLKGGPAWLEIAMPDISATSYQDNAVSIGVNYEYYVARTFDGGPGTAHGYISAGIRAPLVAERGKVILLVDNTVEAPLTAELSRFESDLSGDGWTVVRQAIQRTATPTSVRSAIQSIYNADPGNTVALILFGHIPVAYSGDSAMDGHLDHFGAWPSDVFYSDTNGVWTDTSVNDTSSGSPRTVNIPGDGKFDQTIIPSDIDLQVGRIDLANMPAFMIGGETSADTEIRLLRQYLDRDHQYRHKLPPFHNVVQRGLVDDHFDYMNGEAFAVTPWRGFTACVGAGNVLAQDWFDTLQTQSYLWAYGCGPGTFTSAGNYNPTEMRFEVGQTADFVSKNSLAVFNVTFGSYFGDWDYPDSFLRAPLAGTASSLGLTSCWSGRPHWQFHPMALGETIGYVARLTQNNSGSGTTGYQANFGTRRNHIALLGDPTLRLYPMGLPTSLTATPGAQAIALNWTASSESPIEGYIISRATSPTGPFVRLRSALVSGTSYVDRSVTPGGSYTYMVRAVKLQTSPTGTYLNSSQGVFSAPVNGGSASGPEIEITGNGNPVSAGDTGPLAVNETEFGSVETVYAVTQIFTITNAGNTPLHTSNAGITGLNAGDFSIATAPPATLAAGASTTFQIEFHPSVNGPRTATFTLTTDDSDEGLYEFALGGTGLPPHAEIAVYPPVIDRSIHAGDSVIETLNLSDPGPGALVHTIDSSLTRYTSRDSTQFGGPAYAWVNIAAPENEVTGWSNPDDAILGPFSLDLTVNGSPAAFPLYGNTFTTANLCTNGYLSFTDTNTNAGNAALPAASGAANMVAPFWSDLLLVGGSHVYRKNEGGNFILQYQDVGFYGNPNGSITCQAILKPTGEIVFQYQTLTQTGNNYTVGIQNGARTEALPISFNSPYAQPGLAVRIRPPNLETWVSLSTNSGTVPPGGSQPIAATLDTTGLAPGRYYAELTVNSNAQGAAAVIVPVRLTVGNTPSENWRLEHFDSTTSSGDAAEHNDFDHDGLSNLLEYAFATDPGVPNGTPTPSTSVNGNGYTAIQFQRDATHTDLRIYVEATSNLGAPWTVLASSIHGAPVTSTGAHSSMESGSGDVKTVAVEDSAPASAFAQRFIRVRVLRD